MLSPVVRTTNVMSPMAGCMPPVKLAKLGKAFRDLSQLKAPDGS